MSDLTRFKNLCKSIKSAQESERRVATTTHIEKDGLVVEVGIDISAIVEPYHEAIECLIGLWSLSKQQRETLLTYIYNQDRPIIVEDGDMTFNIVSPTDMWNYILDSEA